jgi:transposase
LKNREGWSKSENRRWKIIQDINEMKWLVTSYNMTQELYMIYEDKWMTKDRAISAILNWIARVRKRKRLVELQVIANMIEPRIDYITNYFVSKHSNWYWEWQNQRIRRLVYDNKWFKDDDYMTFRFIKAFW